MPFVLFRCDGGPDIGMGHIMRCRALDFAFDERGWERGFAVSQATAEWVKDLNPYVVPDGLEGAEMVRSIIQERNAEVVVIDHYGLGIEFEQQLQRPETIVVAIEDQPNRMHRVDVLVDANPARNFSDYAAFTDYETRVLIRSRYAMLRPEFARTRERGQFRILRPKPRKLIIALGGADPDNISARVLEAAPAFREMGLATTLLVGQANPHRESLTTRCRELGVKVLCNPQNLIAVMAGADVAISGAGTMCYEFACLGVPTVALVIAANQREVGRAIASIGAAHILACEKSLETQGLVDAVRGIVSDKFLRERMSAAAQAMVTGDGARNVVERILYHITVVRRWQRQQ